MVCRARSNPNAPLRFAVVVVKMASIHIAFSFFVTCRSGRCLRMYTSGLFSQMLVFPRHTPSLRPLSRVFCRYSTRRGLARLAPYCAPVLQCVDLFFIFSPLRQHIVGARVAPSSGCLLLEMGLVCCQPFLQESPCPWDFACLPLGGCRKTTASICALGPPFLWYFLQRLDKSH